MSNIVGFILASLVGAVVCFLAKRLGFNVRLVALSVSLILTGTLCNIIVMEANGQGKMAMFTLPDWKLYDQHLDKAEFVGSEHIEMTVDNYF